MEISHSSWPWHRSDATALAGYANMMMMMMMINTLQRYLRTAGEFIQGFGTAAFDAMGLCNWKKQSVYEARVLP